MRTRFLAGLALLLTACNRQQSVFAPRGPSAGTIANLGGSVTIAFSVVALIMLALIAWVALRKRGSLADHEPPDAGGGERWILVGGFFIPAFILAVIFIGTLSTMSAFPVHDGHTADHPPDILVTGHQWWWGAKYISPTLCDPGGTQTEADIYQMETANEIHIPIGQPVNIDLQTADVIHSFWIPQLHGKVDLVPGQTNRIRLVAYQPGRYRGECAEFCGEQHAHMILYVVADTPEDYARWIAVERSPASEPKTVKAARGKELFETKACVLCHTIRGTGAHGAVGPDLTHLASRRMIAANSYPNDTAFLTAWVTHAQSLKPGAAMPDLTVFNGEQIQELVAYLQQLQ